MPCVYWIQRFEYCSVSQWQCKIYFGRSNHFLRYTVHRHVVSCPWPAMQQIASLSQNLCSEYWNGVFSFWDVTNRLGWVQKYVSVAGFVGGNIGWVCYLPSTLLSNKGPCLHFSPVKQRHYRIQCQFYFGTSVFSLTSSIYFKCKMYCLCSAFHLIYLSLRNSRVYAIPVFLDQKFKISALN